MNTKDKALYSRVCIIKDMCFDIASRIMLCVNRELSAAEGKTRADICVYNELKVLVEGLGITLEMRPSPHAFSSYEINDFSTFFINGMESHHNRVSWAIDGLEFNIGSPQETTHYHYKNISLNIEQFLLYSNSGELDFKKDFWDQKNWRKK